MRFLFILMMGVYNIGAANAQLILSIDNGFDFLSNDVQQNRSFIYNYSASLAYHFNDRVQISSSVGSIKNVEQQGSDGFLSNLESSGPNNLYFLGTLERINLNILHVDASLKAQIYKNLNVVFGISFFRYDPMGYLNYSVSETLGNEISSGNIGIIEYESTWNNRLKIGLEYLFPFKSINIGPYFSLYYNRNARQFLPTTVSVEATEYVTENEFFLTTGDGFEHRTELWFVGIRLEYSLFK